MIATPGASQACGPSCLRWRRLQPKVGVSKMGRCMARPDQRPVWALLVVNEDDSPREPATPTCGSGLLPIGWGSGCPAFKARTTSAKDLKLRRRRF